MPSALPAPTRRRSLRRGSLRVLLAALVTGLLGTMLSALAVQPAQAVGPDPETPDPSVTGSLEAMRVEYDLPRVDVGKSATGTAGAQILSMRQAGVIHYPTTGSGPFPVLIFQHGNHATCDSGSIVDDELLVSPLTLFAQYENGDCSTDDEFVDELLQIEDSASFTGYDYLAQQLATQGYIVASLDINDITDWSNNSAESGYLGRAQIIAKTFDLIGTWNTTAGPEGIGTDLIGKVDLAGGVGVMGHSRGGEGVNMFAEYNLTRPATAAEAATRMDPEDPTLPQPVPDFGPRYNLKAVFSLAPVDGQGNRRPTIQGTNFATLLPYCDGDVFNLQGAPVFERSKNGLSADGFTAVQYVVNGANHNYYNTIWTADDANLFGLGDPNCNLQAGPTRLQQAEQRQTGFTLINGFMRYFVGGETQFEPIITGESIPPAACPNGGTDIPATVTCRNVIQTSYAAPDRRVLINPTGTFEAPTVPTTTPAGDPITATGVTLTACNPSGGVVVTTAGCPTSPNRSDGPQLTAAWSSATAAVTVAPTGAEADFSDFATLNFRTSPNYDRPTQLPLEYDVTVRLTDTTGASAEVVSSTYSAALETPPGTTARKQIVNGVRIPLTDFTGVDLTKIATLRLGLGSTTQPTGTVQLNDVVLQEPAEADEPVNTAPTAAASATPHTVETGDTVALSAAGSTDAETPDDLTYSWDFGDGGTTEDATTRDTTVTYATAGTYTATLTVTDPGGLTDTESVTITVTDPPPVNTAPTAAATATPDTVETGDTVALSAAGSTDAETPDDLTYSWDFGDGGTTEDATTRDTTVTYATAGTYTATLTVTDPGGLADTESVTITVTDPAPVNTAPVATAAAAPAAVETGETVTLSGAGSTDAETPNGLTFAWDFGDGEPTADAVGEQVTTTFETAGTYTVTLTVTDPEGLSDTDTVQVTVTDPVTPEPEDTTAPKAKLALSTRRTFTGEQVIASSAGTSDDVSAIEDLSYSWNLNNGGSTVDSTRPGISFKFTKPGVQRITLTVTDEAGNSTTVSKRLKVLRYVTCNSRRVDESGSWRKLKTQQARRNVYCDTRGKGEGADALTLDFTGDYLMLVRAKGPNGGKADVFIDGKLVKTLSMKRNGELVFNKRTTFRGLGAGKHTVRVVTRGGIGYWEGFVIQR